MNKKTLLVMAFVVIAHISLAVSEEKMEGSPKPPPPRPSVLVYDKADELHYVKVQQKPGVPIPGQVCEMILDISRKVKIPHPIYGDRIPLGKEVKIKAVVEPESGRGKVEYMVHPLGDAGKFGFHFTPGKKGLHYVTLVAPDDGGGRELEMRLKVYVDVWPVDEPDYKKGGSSIPVPAVAPQ